MKRLKKVNFKNSVENILNIFSNNRIQIPQMENTIKCLADSNFECYNANMEIIDQRKKKLNDLSYKIISDNELIARTVGEKRVHSKAAINKLLSDFYNNKTQKASTWIEDDIVYSVGEMVDRILIEKIKQEDFKLNNETNKLKNSKKWQKKVFQYLDYKIKLVSQSKSYQCIEEMRTYRI